MKLAVISPFPPAITGIGQYGYHVSRLLAVSGAFSKITVLTSHQPRQMVTHSSELLNVQRGWVPDSWNACMKITAKVKAIQPDLVWFNIGASAFGRDPLCNLSGFFSILQSQRLGFPTVATIHEVPELSDLRKLRAPGGAFARSGARLLTNIAMQADVICVTLKRYKDWLSPRLNGRSLVHIPLGAYYPPERLPEAKTPELLFFTTLAPFKGLEILLDSFHELKKSFPALRLTVAGAEHVRFPGYLESVKRRARHLEDIHWLGQVSESQVRSLFQRCQVVVLPYQASTGSSSVMWQAAVYGRAMVASNLAETIASIEENGLKLTLFHSGNAQSLTAAIEHLLNSTSIRQAQTENNHNAIQLHRPQDTCKAYFHAFNLALEARGRTSRIRLPVSLGMEAA